MTVNILNEAKIKKINIYCDESCHLEYDTSKVMVLGAVWLPKNTLKKTCAEIRDIKEKHNFTRAFEFKWTQISSSKLDFYKEIITYFFQHHHLHFRAVVASKQGLEHKNYQQSHDSWYYKIYYQLLRMLLDIKNEHSIYLDIKERRKGGRRVTKLRKILLQYPFIIKNMQCIASHESELIQIADLFCGALAYINNGHNTSNAKIELIQLIGYLSGKDLTKTTTINEEKFNIFHWEPSHNAQ